jgi:hypothetical protein
MEEQGRRNRGGWRLKIVGGLVAVAFAVTLAIIVGNRLSDESLAVLAGAVCGVGAAIPTSLLIVAVTRRRDETRTMQQPGAPYGQYGQYPPVVVVTAPGTQQQAGGWNALPSSMATLPMERHFTVVGSPEFGKEASGREHYS